MRRATNPEGARAKISKRDLAEGRNEVKNNLRKLEERTRERHEKGSKVESKYRNDSISSTQCGRESNIRRQQWRSPRKAEERGAERRAEENQRSARGSQS